MNNRIIGFIFLAIIFIFPFRYLLFNNEPPNVEWLISMTAVMIGYVVLLFIFISKPFESKKIAQLKLEVSTNEIRSENVTYAHPDFTSIPQVN